LFGGDGTSKYPNVPACLIQLFCPQHVAESTGITSDGFDLWWDYGIMPIHGIKLLDPYHQKSNTGLPMMATSGFALYNCFTSTLSAQSQNPFTMGNLSPSQWANSSFSNGVV